MKKILVVLLTALLLLTGCVGDPSVLTVTLPEAELTTTENGDTVPNIPVQTVPEIATMPSHKTETEPQTQETDSIVESAETSSGGKVNPGEEWQSAGYCVDCGSSIKDPADFDPYHCSGCGDSGFLDCTYCRKRIPCVESIRRMCISCYWLSGSKGACCAICGNELDEQIGTGRVCIRCDEKYGEKVHAVMLMPCAHICSICEKESTASALLPSGEFACSECGGQPIPEGGGRCETCGMPYAYNEGFEALCYACQDKYGLKCSICGTDCTYRGTIDGMCDECWALTQTVSTEERCSECGRTGVYISRYGYCDDCYHKNHEGEYGWCTVCGSALVGAEPTSFDGTRCFNCVRCDKCGSDIDTFDPSIGYKCTRCAEILFYCSQCGAACGEFDGLEGLCYACYNAQIIHCGSCGTECTPGKLTTGLCESCWNQQYATDSFQCRYCGLVCDEYADGMCTECYNYQYNTYCPDCGVAYAYCGMEDGVCNMCIYFSTPNVFCPNCGYSWFTTGVGVDGFFCPSCEHNW